MGIARVIVRHASLTGFRAYRARSVFFIFAMSRLWWLAVKDSRLAGRSRRKAAAAELRCLRFYVLWVSMRQSGRIAIRTAVLYSFWQPCYLPISRSIIPLCCTDEESLATQAATA